MKLKLGLVILALAALLIGCQPKVTDVLNQRFGHEAVTVTLSNDAEGFVVMTMDYGVDLVEPAIAIRGFDVAYNNDDCVGVEGGVDCLPGDATAVGDETYNVLDDEDSPYILRFRGRDILANVSFYTIEGDQVGSRLYLETAEIQ